MVKRRRSCDTDTDSFARAKKSKNPLPYDPAEICNELYETIRSYKTDDGRILCDSFVRNKRNREFLEAMRNHIDFTTISQKVKAGSYTNLDQMTNDFEQMINDAKEFFTPDSQDHQDADELWELFNGAKEELIESAMGEGDDDVADDDRLDEDDEEDDDVEEDDDDDDEAEGGGDDEEKVEDQNPFEELFAAVMLAKDPNDRKGRSISEPFQLLPSNSKYPEYYKIITEPIDLRIIAQKIQSNGYKSLNELEADLLLMVKNAKTFNEPGSLIYRDATSLKRIITAKKLQLDSERSKPVKVSKRIQSKRPTTGKRLSAVTAALKYAPDDAEEDDEEDEHESEIEDADMEEEEDEDSAMWMLYNTILNAEDDGVSLSEPFMRLPNRKTYPDYYLEIAKPICMIQIRKKIQRAQYESLNDLADDFTILFTNAMHYNQDESKIHQDARDLLKLMNSKKRDLEKNMPLEGGSTKKQKKEDLFQKRLRLIYDTVLEARDSEDRERDIVGIFMKLPSKKEYPDYYQIIPEPIDMSMINAKIRSSAYITEKELIKDFELMFNNARHYNEENSEIYNDAVLLERILKEKIKTLPPLPYDPAKLNKVSIGKGRGKFVHNPPPLHQKMRDIYEAIRDYSDTHGRVLSGPFMKLPLKTEYPDYYDVIKRPIDMARILQKINASQISVGEGPAADASLQGIKYTNIEEFTADFVLLFDNACKYNEPDSLIYKDALTLQRVLLEKKGEFFEEDSEVPNVAALVQELMLSIFINTYNHKDEEGRCFSDSLGEVPKFDPVGETSSSPTTPLTLDTIKRNLDRGRYHRFDRFQSHMFSVFERARRLSRTDSQVYEDAVEMQMFFIRERDERLKNTLMTSAVNYTDKYLQFQVEAEKRDRRPKEIRDEIEDENKGLPKQDGETLVESLVHNGMMVNVGDFLYADPREAKLEPHIVHVERIWKDASGDTYLWANFFYRPGETYHVATRKFLEKEVFKSDYYEKLPLAKVLGKCFVMFVKDYYRSCPEGFEDKDVWVCESKYVAKNKAFKKMKIWNVKSASDYRIVSRISPKVPVRIPSEFAKAGGTSPMPSAFSDMDVSVIDKERENIPLEVGDEGNQYYEQYNFPVGCFKLGDCAYVKSDTDRPYIARIDRIWEDQAGEAWFTGPWFVFPNEVEHPPTRLFYKREVFLSSVEDVNSIRSVLGKCSVLSYKDYISCRVTEIPEKSTYVVESKYLELEKQIRKIPKGLKSYTLSPRVTDDEIFFFRKQILPQKEPSPMLLKKTDDEEEGLLDANDFIHGLSEDSNMSESMITPAKTLSTPGGLIIASGGSGSPLHPGMPGGGIVLNPSVGIAHNVMMGKGGIKTAKKTMVGSLNKSKSGYIVFASEIRRNIQRANPDASFGDISRIVGEEWRTLPATKKEEYEEKARKMAEEHSRSITVTGLDMPMSPGGVVSGFPIYPGAASPRPVLAGSPAATPTSSLAKSPGPNELVCVYDCLWENCGYQFEELGDLIDHINQTSDAGSHCQATNGEFLCLWQGCNRTKKDPKPFPTAHRLVRHLKEVHLKASAARRIKQCHKGPNFYPSSRRFYSQGQHSNDGMGPPVGMMSPSHNSNSMDGFSTGYRTVAIPQNSVVSMPQQPQHVVMSSASAPQAGATMATHQQPMGVPLDPLFVAPPPKTHKALHSEIYLRYIENLAAKRSTMTDFHSTLSARKTNATPAPGRALPTHWFKDGQPPAHQGNAVDALWALRNYMLKDALSIRAGAISDYAGPL